MNKFNTSAARLPGEFVCAKTPANSDRCVCLSVEVCGNIVGMR